MPPEPGDVIISNAFNDTFVILDPTGKRIAGSFPTLFAAIAFARTHATGNIWQQNCDDRGRLLGNPIRVGLPPL